MVAKRRGRTNRTAMGDFVFYALNGALLLLFSLIILIPLLNIVASSFSDALEVARGNVLLWPVKPSLEGYKAVFAYKGIGMAYGNTIFYTVVGTAINLAMTMAAAYSVSRREVPFRNLFMGLYTFTMLFNGGMIPNYILIKDLRMLNTRWAMLLPGAISVYNMIIARTFIQNIPADLWEAAEIDGCSEAAFFFSMVIPLSTTLLAVLGLYYAVGHWNSYFDAFLYLTDQDKLPLQIKLRAILIANSIDQAFIGDESDWEARQSLAEQLKYGLIIVSSVPVLVLYPYIKKHFVKGVMLGSLKG